MRPEILARLISARDHAAADEIAGRVGRRLLATGATVATAESCTGGMVGELLTRLPGMSRCFRGGAIVYANEEKTRQLGVLPATLAAHGAVSEEVVREMAAGARERFAVQLAVAISGVAGPDGGTADKPVGTVWLALSTPGGVRAQKIFEPGARDHVRVRAACCALEMIEEALAHG